MLDSKSQSFQKSPARGTFYVITKGERMTKADIAMLLIMFTGFGILAIVQACWTMSVINRLNELREVVDGKQEKDKTPVMRRES